MVISLSLGNPVGNSGDDHLWMFPWTSFLSAQLFKHICIKLQAVGLYWDHLFFFFVTPGFPASPRKCFKQARLDCSSNDAVGARSVNRFNILLTRSHSRVSHSHCLATLRIESWSAPVNTPSVAATFKSCKYKRLTFRALISKSVSGVSRIWRATCARSVQLILFGLFASKSNLNGKAVIGSTTRLAKDDACCINTANIDRSSHSQSSVFNLPHSSRQLQSWPERLLHADWSGRSGMSCKLEWING